MQTISPDRVFPFLSHGFARAYWITMRPYLLFVSGISGLAGIALAPSSDPARIVLTFGASFLAYGFGQALTDCFQTDTDALSAPYRPLTQGRVARWQVLAVSVLGLAGCVTVFTAYEPWLILPGLAAGGGLATYTFFKRRWWGGPFYNAWIVAVLCLMAFCAAGGSLLPAPPAGFFWTLGLVLFGYALFVLVGYLKDVRADAATGYQTLPVTFGRTVSAWVSDGIAAFALLCYAHAFASAPFVPPEILASLISVLLGIAGVGYLITGQILTHRNRSDEAAHVPITCTVHSYILLLGSLTVTRRPEWSLAVVTFYVFFVLTMRSRPAVSQI